MHITCVHGHTKQAYTHAHTHMHARTHTQCYVLFRFMRQNLLHND